MLQAEIITFSRPGQDRASAASRARSPLVAGPIS
jgi:hypothetical protein